MRPGKARRVVGQGFAHESAHLHVTGQAAYTDDLPELENTVHAALGLAQQANAVLEVLDLAPVRTCPGVMDVITLADVPGKKVLGPVLDDEPLFADGVTQYIGQPLFAVVATTHEQARRAARAANVTYGAASPAVHLAQGVAQGLKVLPEARLQRGDAEAALARGPRRHQGEVICGGQEQFYLEGQIAYAIPGEDGQMQVHCSTQHPTEMQTLVAEVLGVPAHAVIVSCRRMGGGFGGKETQSWLFACVAALLAHRMHRPVKLRADREDDFLITGKRHDFHTLYDVAYTPEGVITALRFEHRLRCGYSADLSGAVADRQIFHSDNTYFLEHVDIRSLRVKTHTQSNTAFRGFGGPQGILAIEVVIDDIAHRLGLDPLLVRQRNFYGIDTRNITPYGMQVEDNVIAALVDELAQSCDYEARRAARREWNAAHRIVKKGMALVPVKFGISFTTTHLNQAGALVHIYTDGSVLVNHGGTEMGQGLHTKVAQVVAEELGLDLSQVRISATDTGKVANTSATAASTGSDLNGKAAQDAVRRIKAGLAAFASEYHGCDAQEVVFRDRHVYCGENAIVPFAEFVRAAWQARVPLWSSGFYRTPGIHYDFRTLTGRPFFYFVTAAACAEVAVDTLTGEHRLLRADILFDAGRSLNPAIDLGQIEGGFIQGAGWLTTEELWWNDEGRLMTRAPSTYKIPSVSDCPAEFNVAFFDNGNREDNIYQSKAVGEPPLPTAISVFLAIRDAVACARDQRLPPVLHAPATPEHVLDALDALDAAGWP